MHKPTTNCHYHKRKKQNCNKKLMYLKAFLDRSSSLTLELYNTIKDQWTLNVWMGYIKFSFFFSNLGFFPQTLLMFSILFCFVSFSFGVVLVLKLDSRMKKRKKKRYCSVGNFVDKWKMKLKLTSSFYLGDPFT